MNNLIPLGPALPGPRSFWRWIAWVSAILLLSAPAPAAALDVKKLDELIDQVGQKNFEPVETFLRDNEATAAADPDYYVVLLNYALAKGDRGGIVAGKGQAALGDFSLSDPESDEVTGFLGYREDFDVELIGSAIDRTVKSLPAFTSRLDIRIGAIEAASRIKRWTFIGDQLVEILQVSKQINNNWTWGAINTMTGDPEKFMLDNVQGRVAGLFDVGDPSADQSVIRASQAMIKHYPGVIFGYADLGVMYLAKKDYQKAGDYLQRALKIDPNDEIVKGNIAKLEAMRSADKVRAPSNKPRAAAR